MNRFSELSPIKGFSSHIIHTLTTMLESQIRTNLFEQGVITSTIKELDTISLKIADTENNADIAKQKEFIENSYKTLKSSLNLLNNENKKEWKKNCDRIESLIVDSHELADKLTLSLIDKSLFERQSQVLKSIILSHEKVTNWKEFVQSILCQFHVFFPFSFFTIAFKEWNGVCVYLYFLGEFSEEVKKNAKETLSKEVLKKLGLKEDTFLNIEEFEVKGVDERKGKANLEVITVGVPWEIPEDGGILAVSYASNFALTLQEQLIIRSLLSVMVMVVGSSRSLSKSLSKLEYYAQHDPLTGLHNRRYFNEILEYEIDRSARHKHPFSILSIDLDNFKGINDCYGHVMGDNILRHLAQVLRKNLRKSDVLARLGGDEFAVILPETDSPSAQIVGEMLRQSVSDYEFLLNMESKQAVHITISVGLVSYPLDAKNINDLMSGVDIALYQAKKVGKDYVCTLRSVEKSVAQSKLDHGVSEILRKALQEKRIVPYFQPIIDIRSGATYAYEALARLETEAGEIISAGQFIEAADKYGISLNLDQVMLYKVILAMEQRQQEVGEAPLVFVNLTPQEIQRRDILQYAADLCNDHNIPPEKIVFEITEREAISDLSNMRQFLLALRNKGFSFALDDFGSGYNSFHYLRELHFEYVKIDGTFVTNMNNSKVDSALVETLSSLCQKLGMMIVAEFVESEEVFEQLGKFGIEFAQGYHLGLPRDQFAKAAVV